MDTKIIRKVTSILMVAIIMGSTLTSPIVNIGKVVAETYSNVSTDNATVETDSASSDIEDVATTEETVTPAEVEIPDTSTDAPDTENSDVTTQESTGTDITKVEPNSSAVPEDNAQTSSSSDSSSPSTSKSASINPTANDPPYPGEPYFDQNSGPFCGAIQDNAGAPKFRGLVQYNADQGNFLTVKYNGGSDGIPQGYAATYVTFYDPNRAGDTSSTAIAYGPVKLNAAAPTWDFSAAPNGAAENIMNIEIDPEHLPVVLNLLNNGQVTLKYVVTYEKPSANGTATGDCIRKVSNSAHTDNFVPFIKKPTFTATQSCATDCDVDLTLNFTGSDYSTHSRYVVQRYTGSIATGTPTTIIDQEITNSGVNTINFTDTTIPSPGGTYTYKFYIDLYGVNSDTYNPVATPNATLTVSDKPTGSITSVDRLNSSSFNVHYNIDFKNYSIAANSIHAFVEMYRVTPGSPETLTKVATSSDITTNATGGTSYRNFDASAYGPGTYRFKLIIDYGTKVGSEFPCNLSLFSSDFKVYGQPTITPSQSCDVECSIHLAFGYDASEYSQSDVLVLLKDGVFVGAYPVPIASKDLVLSTDIFTEHNYSFYIDTNDVPNDNDVHTRDSFEPLSNVAEYTLLQKPTLGEVTTELVGTDQIDVDFTADLYNSGAVVSVQIDGGDLIAPTLDSEGYHHSFKDLDFGPHTVKVIIEYQRDDIECDDIIDTSVVTIDTPEINITPSQSCDVECTVHLAFDYDADDYSMGDVLVLLKDGNFVSAYPLSVDSVDLELESDIFSEHNYSFYIDTNDVAGDDVHTRDSFETLSNIAEYTLLQKPVLGEVTTEIVGNDQIDVDFTAELYNSGAVVSVQIDGGDLIAPTLDDQGYHHSFKDLDYGPHTVKVIIEYQREGIECDDIIDTSVVTIETPEISIDASQSCDVECTIHLAFDYDANDYSMGDVLVLLKDGEFVSAYPLSVDSVDLELENDIFSEHNYSFYIDTNDVAGDDVHTRDLFETLSNIVEYTLLQKPVLGEVTTEVVGTDQIDVDFTAELYNSGAVVSVQIDGGELIAPTLDDDGYHHSFKDLDYGPHTVNVIIEYQREGIDCPDIEDTSIVTIPTSAITITPSQSCDVECIVHLEFDYDAEEYDAQNDVLVLLKDGDFVSAYPLSVNSVDLELENDIFSEHNYSFYIDTNDVVGDDVHTRDSFETLSNIAEYTLLQKPVLGDVTTTVVGTDQIDVDFTADLYNSGAVVSVQIDGGELETPTLNITGYHHSFKGLDYGPHTVKVVIDYQREGIECPDIIDTSVVTIETPEINITPSQSCDVECTVHLAFDYNAEEYAIDDVLVLLKDGEFVSAYPLSVDSVDLELESDIFSEHNYSFYIDTNDVAGDDVHTRDSFETLSNIAEYTLLQKPALGEVTTEVVGTDQIDVDFTAELYNSGAVVSVQIDGGELIAPMLDDQGYHHSFKDLDYGPHTVKVIIEYQREGIECDDIIDTSVVTIETPEISIDASQSCDVECIVHLAFDYDAEDYAIGDVLVLLKDGVFVDAYNLGTNSVDLELTTDIFSEHNYSFYIDTNDVLGDNDLHTRDAFETLSNVTEYTLLQKPDLGEVTTTVVGTDQIDVDFMANLYNSGASVSVQIDGGALQTPTLDGEGYHYSFMGLDYGPHEVKVVIMYQREGVECPDIFDTSTVTIATPAINITPSQSCDVECTVHLAFDYDANDYAENDVLVLLKDGEFVGAYDLTTDSIDLELTDAIFSLHNYSFYIDTNDVLGDNDLHTRDAFETLSNIAQYTLLQKPDLGDVTTEVVGTDQIDVDFTANLYNSNASVSVQIDGGELQTPTLDDEGYHYSFTGLDYGPHEVKVVIMYARDRIDCPDIVNTSTVTILTPEIAITPSQSCDVECSIHLAFDYDANDYAENDMLVLLKDGAFVEAYDLSVSNVDLELTTDIFTEHNYSFYIDTNDVLGDDVHTRDSFETLSNVAPYTLLQKPELLDSVVITPDRESNSINLNFDTKLYNSGAKVSVKLDENNSVDITSEGVFDEETGITTFDYTIMDVAYGSHEVSVIIEYSRSDVECPAIINEYTTAIPFPDVAITASQVCGKECIVELAFDYDAGDYPEGSKLVLLKDGEFVEAFDLGTLNTSLLLETAIFEGHDYSFFIDTNPIVIEENEALVEAASVTYERDFYETLSNIEHFTLLQRPDVSNVVATLDSFDRINVDANIDLHNSGARVFIQLDNGPVRDVTSLIESGKLRDVLSNVTPGEHDIYLTIEYSRMGLDCPNLQEHVSVVVNALETPTIEASQDCNKDCIVDLTLGYDASVYPEDSDVVVLQDGKEVLRYMLSDASHKVEGENLYNYELTVNDFLSHTYLVYIDTNLADEFDAYSEEIDFRLFEKPEIESIEMVKNEDSTITIDYKAILHDYADATGMIVVTGSNGYTKTINIDSMDLSNGSFTTEKLAAGTYNATFTINFGEDCEPVVLDAKPIKIEPKLVYTGYDNSLFEKVIIEIKEIFANAA